MRIRAMLAIAVALLAVGRLDAPAGTKVPETAMEGAAAEAMHRYLDALVPFGFHGTALVAHHGRVILHQGYGIADPTTGRPTTTATMYSTGSVTKQFTATAIMKLASQGRLSPQDPITTYFDAVPDDKRAITLHHLLTHTAGLRPAYGADDESIERDDLVRRILEYPLMNPVGDVYEYSNAGYTLLAVIVEKLTGMPYEQYLRETFYLPTGMTSTGLTSLEIDPQRVARSHNADAGNPSPAERGADAWNLYGNGGQLSTTADMYRWIAALRSGKLVERDYQEQMFTRYAAEGPQGQCHYGYGWSICDTRRGGDVVWHNGGAMGLWGCAVYQYIDDDAVFIVFTNSTINGRAPEDHICVNLSRILFGEAVETPPDLSRTTAVDASGLAGTYALADGGSLTVRAVDGGIEVTPEGQTAMATLFTSEMNDMLPRYNDKTAAMVEAIRGGDFERAARDVEMEVDSELTGADWLRGWWESIDDLGELERIEVVGTRFAPPAETYLRLHFAAGVREFCFYWMMGRCVGIAPAPPPARMMHAVSPRRFTAFGLDGGVDAEFTDGAVRVQAPGQTIEGTRDG